MPYWAHNGRELFFMEPETRAMMAAQFETTPRFRVVDRELLFTIPTDYETASVILSYDVARDDQRFLMGRSYTGTEEGEANRFVLGRNFFEELRARLGN